MANEEGEDAALLKFSKDFADAHVLTNSEVAIILDHRQSKSFSGEADSKNLTQTFHKTLAYTKRFSRIKNQQAVSELRSMLEGRHSGDKKLEPFQLVSLVNLCPETAEEARALIPTLDRFDDAELDEMLKDIASFREGV
eukprot:tig00000241_g20895.t1